ncbi:type II toxin-antitoxin system PemK/MazF family toxin [Polynucleobacter sp. 15G-AUS-farblos]|uniref:type II toxin-antitoxin system PemK/MazF family toxin n=1 Tax=Polynucleobacter sp. 15G-AUS-farblos TaxID=2689094 RepID=UPI001C0B2354|nr:type II toxin-antitoxin system PemK/MazF family toxin [Polynucleobacter sp. 15G-AUS-farblos]
MVGRGEIWLIKLDPTKGSEIKKTRPCLIVSPQEMNDYLNTVIIAPMSTKARAAEFRIPITHDKKQGLILLDQIRTIDKGLLLKKIGSSSPKTLQASLRVLQEAFAI